MLTRYAAFPSLLLCACAAFPARGDDRKPDVTEKQFRRASLALLEDPLGDSAPDQAKQVVLFTMQTPDAAVALGREEMKWTGKDDKRGLLLLAAYLAGDVQSQLNSGVQRNDRYAGLLSLFGVYRRLREQDKDFHVAEVDELLKLHADDKLTGYLADLEKRKPTKLTPEEEEAIQKLLKEKK
jgi:hypothetical protein